MPPPLPPTSSSAGLWSAAPREMSTLVVAAGLALAAAVSLGLARFSYALLLPPMRADLGWSYLTAGAMNTVNVSGYLVGALAMPAALRRFGARRLLLVGGSASAALLVAHGFATSNAALYVLRALTGLASAASFVCGGLLAARLANRPAPAPRASSTGGALARAAPSAGLVLGVYYGGTGFGILLATALVPSLSALPFAHAWQWAWIGLGITSAVATVVTAIATQGLDASSGPRTEAPTFRWRPLTFGLCSYFLFGLGYIGYMTFVVTLLHEAHLSDAVIVAFFAVLGMASIASSWIWAGLLQRHHGGGALRLLNALVGAATLLPVLSPNVLVVFISGTLFGGVFLSVVASTTALVRHNLPNASWPAGISAFTIVFAAGQIVGPTLVGWVADAGFGLRGGLACSAAVLLLAAIAATGQRPLRQEEF